MSKRIESLDLTYLKHFDAKRLCSNGEVDHKPENNKQSQTAYWNAQGWLDVVVGRALSGDRASTKEVIEVNRLGYIDHSRIVRALKTGVFNIDTFIALDRLVNTGNKNQSTLPFPKSKILRVTGVNTFISRLNVDDGVRFLYWMQAVVERGSYGVNNDAIWRPSLMLIEPWVMRGGSILTAVCRYLNQPIALNEYDYQLFYSNRVSVLKGRNLYFAQKLEGLIQTYYIKAQRDQ